ncbi:hypothetical protein CfE428DRAFT_2877 [Chthoniobacter flavus Ellin428]|uniref:DUF4412 domain-containing protein n=1 Tax=Chthoniobacter flavus Ellin428 TaxID=497964 RepID=B4D1T9_9BACT|nr:DUF6263 family protein [Chthoniobacter flavus]EDY19701.1 hypothetical protein CfE428DRAFT_2877 [Chthoniobacter flavus Ellin428]
MKFSTRFLSIIALALSTALPASAAETVEIKPQWMAGKRYYETMQTDQVSSFEVAGKKMEQSTSMTIELTMTVSPHQDGQPKRMTIRYERMAMGVEINGQKMGFDSANPGASGDPLNLSKTMGATVGQELKVVFNNKDEIADIENYDEFVSHFGAAATPGFDPKKMFNKEALTEMMKQGALRATPGKPVAVGDTWDFSNQIDLPALGKVVVKGNYTLKSIGDHNGVRCAEIEMDGQLSMDIGEAKRDAASPFSELGMKVSNGTLKGPMWFDPQLGMARDSQLVQEVTISMKNPADPTAMMEMPMKQNISMKLTKVEDVK